MTANEQRWVHLRDLDHRRMPSGSPVAHGLVGFSDSGQDRSDLLVAQIKPFPVAGPRIAEFSVSGHSALEVERFASAPTIELSWSVVGAERVFLRLASAPTDFSPSIPPEVSAAGTMTFPLDDLATWGCWSGASPMFGNSTAASCGPIRFELEAIGPDRGRCSGTRDTAQVTVFLRDTPLSAAEMQMLTSTCVVLARFSDFSKTDFLEPLAPSHPDVVTAKPVIRNRCIRRIGLPYARPSGGPALFGSLASAPGTATPPLDDREPSVLFYAADALGHPTQLAAWGFGGILDAPRPVFSGIDWGATALWFGHWGGYHTGDGGMSILTKATAPLCGVTSFVRPPPQPPLCPDIVGNKWGPSPYLPHPALWDLRVFFDPEAGLPRVGIFATEAPISMIPDPCLAITDPIWLPLSDQAWNLPISTFFALDASGAPVPIPIPHPIPLVGG